jgi:RNA polymerase sigma factor for flagellar operon FliA
MSAVLEGHKVPSESRRRRPRKRAAAERDRLVLTYRPYVIKLARLIAETVPIHVEIDDLIGWGHWGLMEAATRFDEQRGVAFRTFAHRRIVGAMYDGLRREHSVSTRLQLPSDEVLGAGWHPSAVIGDRAYAKEPVYSGPFEARGMSPNAAHQEHELMLGELSDRIATAMKTLTPLERRIIRQRYFDDKPVQKLCKRTRYSKSWLSRVHTRALARLREQLEQEGNVRELGGERQ